MAWRQSFRLASALCPAGQHDGQRHEFATLSLDGQGDRRGLGSHRAAVELSDSAFTPRRH
jgi:hypothetical protein